MRTLSSVHPRVGGEQTVGSGANGASTGSSPRGRGTARRARCHEGLGRFIPAWAGNRRSQAALRATAPVHPRVGGEQSAPHTARAREAGSSPRGRGTAGSPRSRSSPGRFIPAWAGNSRITFSLTNETAVHPRVGGEQMSGWAMSTGRAGSSPRGRGTGLAPRP